MKKIGFIAVMCCLMLSGLSAQKQDRKSQEERSPEAVATMRVDKMASQVTLTEAERTKLVALFTKTEQDRRQAHEDQLQARKVRRAATQTELKEILGSEKFAQLQEAQKKERAEHPKKVHEAKKK